MKFSSEKLLIINKNGEKFIFWKNYSALAGSFRQFRISLVSRPAIPIIFIKVTIGLIEQSTIVIRVIGILKSLFFLITQLP